MEPEFHDWFRGELELLEIPETGLTGEAMKEDVYRKACMRDGAVELYNRILALGEAPTSVDVGEIDLFE